MKSIFTGTVRLETVAPGSKSEHEAAVLNTGTDKLILRMRNGNPFDNTAFTDFFNKTVSVEGLRYKQLLLVDKKDDITLAP